MDPYLATTPVGRRPLSPAQITAHAAVSKTPKDRTVSKWTVLRDLCTARERFGLQDRTLVVLEAILGLHAEAMLTGTTGMVVFASNATLSVRAKGMAPSTLRRHYAALVEAGLLIRRDSPNGKRYAHKNSEGEIQQAFGFDLAPLVARADEIAAAAAVVLAEQTALRLVRQRITLCRRDIAKTIVAGLEACADERSQGHWLAAQRAFQAILARIPRKGALETLTALATELTGMADALMDELQEKYRTPDDAAETAKMSANESHFERQYQSQTADSVLGSELLPMTARDGEASHAPDAERPPAKTYPLEMVLEACPAIADYGVIEGAIRHWKDFHRAVQTARSALGISPSAWDDAVAAMGQQTAAIVVACILQRGASVNTPGGYLRRLTANARAGKTDAGRMLIAELKRNIDGRRRDPAPRQGRGGPPPPAPPPNFGRTDDGAASTTNTPVSNLVRTLIARGTGRGGAGR